MITSCIKPLRLCTTEKFEIAEKAESYCKELMEKGKATENLTEKAKARRINPKIRVALNPLEGNPKGLAIIVTGSRKAKTNALEVVTAGKDMGSVIMAIIGNETEGRGEIGEL